MSDPQLLSVEWNGLAKRALCRQGPHKIPFPRPPLCGLSAAHGHHTCVALLCAIALINVLLDRVVLFLKRGGIDPVMTLRLTWSGGSTLAGVSMRCLVHVDRD